MPTQDTEKQAGAKTIRLIDFHVHPWKPQVWSYPERQGLSPEQLIDRMNREGVDRSVLLPEESPECTEYILTREVVEIRDIYPERFIAFVSIDPRQTRMAERVAACVEKWDCRGFGELKNGLLFDDPLNEAIYEVCAHYSLPIVFHCDMRLCRDEAGLPRLEAMAAKYPQATFVGHGPGFWSAISADDDRSENYPSGPIQPGGALDRLFAHYPNVYGEFSAGSGLRAMTRDPGFIHGFLQRNHGKLIFGTDFITPGQKLGQFEWLATLDIPIEWRQEMAYGNAERVLAVTGEQ